ncbi:MAG: peptide chain release factor N(5)-glutamine methyltransferase [Terricaulis sp.]
MSATLVSLWTEVRQRLERAGIESPVADSRLLVEAGAGVTRLDIITDPRRQMSADQIAAVAALARRREKREPLAQILGRAHFWTFELAVNSSVLIPRPETELLVETALDALAPGAPTRVLDLGIGSGAILLAILSERPLASGVGIDVSEDALVVVQANATMLGLEQRVLLRRGDWGREQEGGFDVVVSNPPYIVTQDLAGLQPEVARFEPHLALDGGADGLSAYRAILADLPRLLNPGGTFAFEVGQGQADEVRVLAERAGLATETPKLDLSGIARVVFGRSPS